MAKKGTRPCPKLRVLNKFHRLEMVDGVATWKSGMVDVEVTSIHFSTGKMRVRTIEKVSHFPGDKPETMCFDVDSEAYFAAYPQARPIER